MDSRSFSFDAGRVSLDLLATLGNRREERLPDAAALEAWLRAVGVIEHPCRADVADLARARSLRGALAAAIDAQLRGGLPGPRDLDAINAAAAVPVRGPHLVLGEEGLRGEPSVASAAEALGLIARDAVELLGGAQRELLRECAAQDCSGIYLDASRGRTRRWCSAARCGNRARVAAHRARTAGAT